MKTKCVGTCNVEAGRIWLNLELIKKPPQCLEYIIVHEAPRPFHRAKSRSERSVALMDTLVPQWRLFRDELNAEPLAHDEWQY